MPVSELKIGNVALKNNLILAPLAGYTDIAFRRLCMECGAGLSVTEMVSVKGLCYKNKQTFEMLRTSEAEVPTCVQLFGSDPSDFKQALSLGVLDKFDIFDINMGCPVNKVVKNGEGSALLKTPDIAAAIVSTLAETGKPVTVKMRSGFKADENVAVPFALKMQKAGAAMVTVHARTTAQLYGGKADYNIVGEVRDALDIPVTLSGDIVDFSSFAERSSFADAFMIGRGALINPSIFSVLTGGQESKKYPLIKRHLAYLEEYFNERYAVVTIRKFFAYYLKGERGTKEFKNLIYEAQSLAEVNRLVDKYLSGI
ncbi:MAG: tRNA-dihydrouridine synthase [Clostridiales bacterium]|nr:tRNA-dihydrouridine synthase [Clostridiales bacterium]